MQTIRKTYKARCLTELHHGGNEKTGSQTGLRRLPYLIGSEEEEIPYIDGNAIRGRLRRLISAWLLRTIGYECRTDLLYHLLMAGGTLEDIGSSGIFTIERNRRIRQLLPHLSLLGGSYGNQALAGKMAVGHLLPYCKELVQGGYLTEDLDIPLRSVYELVEWKHNTRRDDRQIESEQTVQMLYEMEVFKPGTVLVGTIVLYDPSELDLACAEWMLTLWREKDPTIGGRSHQGMGWLDLQIPALADSQPYLEFVEQERTAIIALLEEMDGIRAATS